MDVSSRMRNSKNQKLNEEHDMDGSSNIIGNLPDVILQHILSLLPTNVAVRTSILSKRWQYLWMSIPNLYFFQGLPAKRRLFMNFVERVLVLRDSSNVEKFCLACDVLYDASRIGLWISAALRRNVQEMFIGLSNFEESFVLPRCLFTCDSLTKLKVEMRYILKLPPTICFSSLKILTLRYVTFLDDYSTQRLFSGCPLLEQLCIDRCNWENLKAVCISAPKLWSLIMHDDDYDYESESSGCQVMIFGMSLKYFTYTGEFNNDYCLYDSSSLVEACIELRECDQRAREVAYRVKKLLRGFSNVYELTLSRGVIEVLDCAEELFAHLPMFDNLTNLQLSLWSLDSHPDPGLMDFNCRALLSILQKSPCLQTLTFLEGTALYASCVEDYRILDPVPPFFSSHLNSIKVIVIWNNGM